MYSRSVVAGFLRWKLALPSLALVLALAAGGLGTVIAVNISLTTKSLMGTRATTSPFTTVTATHVGTNVATLAQVGAAASSITPSATDATAAPALVRAGAVTAGYYIYSIKFESTAVGDDIPAGTLRARWTVGGTENTASLAVTATTVGASAKGGFTLVIPGGLADTPENIQVVYEQ